MAPLVASTKGDDDNVADTDADLMVAAGASVDLRGFEWLDAAQSRGKTAQRVVNKVRSRRCHISIIDA